MPQLKTGDLVAGKYRILRTIGRGGMGEVYQALHERLDRQVALKVLQARVDQFSSGVIRFEQEIKAMSLVNNPYVTRALDADILDDGSLYLVMEYLEGRDLRAELKLRRTIAYQEAVAYVMQACEGVSAVHQVGIVHRDLKPQNLFLTHLDAARRVKVLDFGLAKFLQAEIISLTATNMTVGTPLYMSPEQLCAPQDVSPRADIWALGVVLYELIAGISPFSADSPGAVVAAVVLEEPIALSDAVPDVPAALSDLLGEVFVKSPANRLGSMQEFAERLAPFGMPRDAIFVSASVPSQSMAVTRERITQRPELSLRIKNQVAAFSEDNRDRKQGSSLGSLRPLPILAGLSLPLSSDAPESRSKPPGQRLAGSTNASQETSPARHSRFRHVWLLTAIAVTASALFIARAMNRATRESRRDPAITLPSSSSNVAVRIADSQVTERAVSVSGAQVASAAAPLLQSTAVRVPRRAAAPTSQAQTRRLPAPRLPPPAATAPSSRPTTPLAADGKPLHL
jgi:serine/threonine protein kinase